MLKMLVLRYLIARRGMALVVSSFSLLGIILGVAALIVVMSVMSGFREELTSKILGITGHATVTRIGLTTDEAYDLRQKLVALPNVTAAEPYAQGQAMVVQGKRASGALVRGVSPLQDNLLVREKITAGNWADIEKPAHVVIGHTLANSLGTYAGGYITLLSPQGTHTAFGFVPRMQRFKVAGVFNVGMYQYDSGIIFTSLKTAQNFFKLGDGVSALDLRVKDPSTLDKQMMSLVAAIGDRPHIQPWMQNNKQFFDALQVERITMFIILSLIIIVAAFNIITGQTMAVQDKRTDIAILRTMGATKQSILRIFFLNGLLIGVLGTSLGTLLGLFITKNLQAIVNVVENLLGIDVFAEEIYFLSEISGHVIPSDVFWVIGMSLLLSILASLYPAFLAGRTGPVEVLRNG